MDMSSFKQHLREVEGKLTHPQASAMYEQKRPKQSLESTIRNLNENVEEGILGGVAGAVGGGLAAGPLGALAGGYLGHKIQQGANKKKKQESVGADSEEVVTEYLTSYFGGEITEDTTDDDILEAIQNIFTLEEMVVEYLSEDTVDESIEVEINAYLTEYFGGTISEDTTEEDLVEAVEDLFVLCKAAHEVFSN